MLGISSNSLRWSSSYWLSGRRDLVRPPPTTTKRLLLDWIEGARWKNWDLSSRSTPRDLSMRGKTIGSNLPVCMSVSPNSQVNSGSRIRTFQPLSHRTCKREITQHMLWGCPNQNATRLAHAGESSWLSMIFLGIVSHSERHMVLVAVLLLLLKICRSWW